MHMISEIQVTKLLPRTFHEASLVLDIS